MPSQTSSVIKHPIAISSKENNIIRMLDDGLFAEGTGKVNYQDTNTVDLESVNGNLEGRVIISSQKFEDDRYYDTKTKKLYRIIYQPGITWKEAYDWCIANGGMLAMFKDEDRMRFLANVISPHIAGDERLWVGATNEGHEDYYTWIDGTPLDDTMRWSDGQPDNLSGNENFLQVRLGESSNTIGFYDKENNYVMTTGFIFDDVIGASEKWHELKSYKPEFPNAIHELEDGIYAPDYYNWINTKIDEVEDTNTVDMIRDGNKVSAKVIISSQPFTDNQFYDSKHGALYEVVFSSGISWTDARQWCVNNGGDLACPKTQEEMDYIKTIISKHYTGGTLGLWLGGTDQDVEGEWRWIDDNSLIEYNNWAAGEPNNLSNEDYMEVYIGSGAGLWNDYANSKGSLIAGFIMRNRVKEQEIKNRDKNYKPEYPNAIHELDDGIYAPDYYDLIMEVKNSSNLIFDETTTIKFNDVEEEELSDGSVVNHVSAVTKVAKSTENAIVIKNTGLFVDRSPEIEIEDTLTGHLFYEALGETLEFIYNNGQVFSHNTNSWSKIYSTAEANAWYFDNNLGSFVQPRNTSYLTGFVSKSVFRTYTHQCIIRSSNNDNDVNGLVICYKEDDEGKPHNLCCVVERGNDFGYQYALIYDYGLPDQTLLYRQGNTSLGNATLPITGGWSNNYITMRVEKAGNEIICCVSPWNSTVLNEATTIQIDLLDYSWGELFLGRVHYGYCNWSQAYSYFTDIQFNGKGPLKCDVILSNKEGNCLQIMDDGLYCNIEGIVSDATKISEKERNALKKEEDGLFVQDKEFKDTTTVKFIDNGTTVKANVKIDGSEENSIVIKSGGLFVDKSVEIDTEDTFSGHLYYEGKGETLRSMYDKGNKFSHDGSWNKIANTYENDTWYFNNEKQSFVQTENTSTFVGFVSTLKYKTYTHQCILRSDNSDDDLNGLVIAYCEDTEGKPHNLCCVVGRGTDFWQYALVYDCGLPDQEVVAMNGNTDAGNSTLPVCNSGWTGHSIMMSVEKTGNQVSCAVSKWDLNYIDTTTTITINLRDYAWGAQFLDRVQYGYCNWSQSDSYWTDIIFNGKGPLKCDVILSPDEGNKLEIRNNGLYCGDGGEADKVKISAQEGNKIEQREDGIYVGGSESVKISSKSGNLLTQKEDGLYVGEEIINMSAAIAEDVAELNRGD